MRRRTGGLMLKPLAAAFLFLLPALAGCLDSDEARPLSADDLQVAPQLLTGGEFQPLVLTARQAMAVYIPYLLLNPATGYIQNSTVVDLVLGETVQLQVLAPPRIDSAYLFIGESGRQHWPARDPGESWEAWVARGMPAATMVERVPQAAGLDALNASRDSGAGRVVPLRVPVVRPQSPAYALEEGGRFATGVVDGRSVFNTIRKITDDTLAPDPYDGAAGYLDRWAGQGNHAYEDAAQFLIRELESYGLEVQAHRFEFTDIFGNQNPEAYNICGYRYGTLYPDEWLVFGAHFDVAPPTNAGLLDPHVTGSRSYGTRVGAYDNTAGTSMVLNVAEAMSDFASRRTMVFCLWSGEEGGKRGSDYWTEYYVKGDHPEVTVTNYVNLDMAGVNWPGGGGAPHGDPDPQPSESGYPKDTEIWPLRLYIGPSEDYDVVNQPGMVQLVRWVGADAINVSAQMDVLVGNESDDASTWKYDAWLRQDRPEVIVYEDTTARSDHASFQDNLGTITLGYGGLVDGYWCYHQTCDTLEEMTEWMDNSEPARPYGNNATGEENIVNSLDIITWWALYMFFHLDEKPVLNTYLD
jgi:hypothetical protein